jgi:hypothetical protein
MRVRSSLMLAGMHSFLAHPGFSVLMAGLITGMEDAKY